VPHHDPNLHLADSITIKFKRQKNNECDATVTQHHTLDPELCPVLAWASLVNRVLSHDGTGPSTPVCTIKGSDGKLFQLTSTMMLTGLQAIVTVIGEEELGIKAMDRGTHSI